jgi:hypothetical protein
MNNIMVIGDVHGLLGDYQDLIHKHKGMTIQVGDFGFKKEHTWHLKNIDSTKHKISFGNHDDYTFLNEPHSLGNYTYMEEYGIMTIRGAYSIDKQWRTEGKDWWPNEELNMEEMQEVIDKYIQIKPKIVITHDCPQFLRELWFGIEDKCMTTNGFQFMFYEHKPDMWIFGHHHKDISDDVYGTKFVCLDELGTIII